METYSLPQLLMVAVILAPGAAFCALALCWLVGWHPAERAANRLTKLTYLVAAVAVAWLGLELRKTGQYLLTLQLHDWFAVGRYRFPLLLRLDWLSLPMVAMTVLLVGVVAAFSFRYLHRDRGFVRFFVLLHLFAFGSILAFCAGTLELLIAGWELVGITSVLLIAFFQERPEPVRSAFVVFAIYRTCDLGLLLGVVALHHFAGSALFPAPELSTGAATLVGLLLLLAAAGKSAQVPFSGWLPRAMEGPTPSSAIFYGAISVHAGAYLLLRAQSILAESPIASAAVIAVGLISAIHGTMVGRACADAKTSLAYASLTQLGLIFVEIGCGLPTIALIHILGHAAVRTLQFLRAPSMLHDFHHLHAAAGGQLSPTGVQYDALLPPPVRKWLYRLAIDRGHHDTILDRFGIGPLIKLAGRLLALELRLWGSARGIDG